MTKKPYTLTRADIERHNREVAHSRPYQRTDAGDDVPCPTCHGASAVLGVLGDQLWFRCIYCGTEFAHQKEA